jgi:hypothetical protein
VSMIIRSRGNKLLIILISKKHFLAANFISYLGIIYCLFRFSNLFSRYGHCRFKATYLHEVYCIIILRVCYPVFVGMTTNYLPVNCRQIVFSLNCFLISYRPIYIANIQRLSCVRAFHHKTICMLYLLPWLINLLCL